jgi:hypothetical protein
VGLRPLPPPMACAECKPEAMRQVSNETLGCAHIAKRIHPERDCPDCQWERDISAVIAREQGKVRNTGVSGIPYWDEMEEDWVWSGDAERFGAALSQVAGKRLTFAEVTGKVAERQVAN